jgi:hypothetical protein
VNIDSLDARPAFSSKEETMTSKQAREFIARYPNALSYVKESHLEELSQLLEVHIEAIEVRKDEFHDLKGSFSPRKETTDRFAQASGVSFNTTAEATRKEGDGCYVGTAQAMVLGPDGKQILGAICEYEFDVDVRLEEMKLNGKTEWDNGRKLSPREYTQKELAQERIQLLKVGRQRANTGARSRATLAILGMQTGFKNFFGKNDPDTATRTFLFSRIIINAKNELVMHRMLDSIGGNAAALFGPSAAKAPREIASPTTSGEQEARRVGPGFDEEGPGKDPFGDSLEPTARASTSDPRVSEIIAALAEWANGDKPTVAKRAQAIIDRGESNLRVLEASLAIIKYIASGKLRERGVAASLEALDNTGSDPIILEQVCAQAKSAYDARAGVPA